MEPGSDVNKVKSIFLEEKKCGGQKLMDTMMILRKKFIKFKEFFHTHTQMVLLSNNFWLD